LKRVDQAMAELKASGQANKTIEELIAEYKARLDK
jgi:hypothetical protein